MPPDDSTIQPASPYPPSPSIQKFLLVEVRKGSSKEDFARAIAEALQSKDVPFFPGSMAAQNVPPKITGGAMGQTAQTPAAASLGDEYPEKALLILVREEGP